MITDTRVQRLIAEMTVTDDQVGLILVDKQTKRVLHATSNRDSFAFANLSMVEELFDQTEQTLIRHNGAHLSVQELPILEYVRQWNVTIVSKALNGCITLSEGSASSVESHLGVG